MLVFPELALTGYTCADLFQQAALQKAALAALEQIATASRTLGPSLTAVGLPVAVDDQLFNCAALIQRGRVLGLVPKSFIPNYKEFYEGRWFAAAATARSRQVSAQRSHRAFRHRRTFSRHKMSKAWSSAWRSARTCGCRSRRARSRPCTAPRCWSTCRPATRSSARAAIAGSSSSTNPAAAWPPTSTLPAASGNRPPTWSLAAIA